MDSDPIEETPPRRSIMNHTNQPNNSQDEYGEDVFDDDTIQQSDSIATQPLYNYRNAMPYSSPSNVSSPPAPHYTQPTQMLNPQHHTPQRIYNGSHIQVPNSASPQPTFRVDNSRFAQPSQQYSQPFSQPIFNRAMMAPPGTVFRPPMPAQNLPAYPVADGSGTTFSQMSNFDDPPLAADSDSDGDGHRSDIPPASFVFQERINQFQYHAPLGKAPQKRVAEDSASAYGGISRPPKIPRTMPANTLSNKEFQDMEIGQILDWDEREKVNRMRNINPTYPIRKCLNMLRAKKGNFDDAIDAVMAEQEKELSKSSANVVHLSDDDEDEVQIVGSTASSQTGPAKPKANRGIDTKGTSILAKYSNFGQQEQPLAPKPTPSRQPLPQPRPVVPTAINSAPPPPMTPPKPLRKRLQQGRRPDRRIDSSPIGSRSPIVHSPAVPSPQTSVLPPRKKAVDSDQYDSEAEAEPEHREDIDEQAFDYFNKLATEQDLRDMTNCKAEEATLMLSKRPFRSLDHVRKVAVPPKDPKAKKRGGGSKRTLGDRIVDKVVEMMTCLEAVDRVVNICEGYANDLRSDLGKLGIDTDKAISEGGLAVTSLGDEPRNDSGVATPASTSDNLFPQPAIMSSQETMKDFQLVGMNWLNLMWTQGKKWSKNSGCILADEMGLGKTLQIISFLSLLLEANIEGPHLIVVPATTLENWMRELRRFSPNIRFEPYCGNQVERQEMQLKIEEHLQDEENRGKLHVIVTTYNLASQAKDCYWLRKTFKFQACIFDEGHMLKNRDTERYRALKKIRAQFRVLLTGTPLQNNLQELVSVLAFIMPDLFEECEEDLNLIFSHKAKTTDEDHAALLSKQRIARAKTMLIPFILRRTKDQVMKDLPTKTKRVVYCDMTPRQTAMYQGYTQKHQEILEARKAGKPVDNEKVPHLMHRRLAAIHPLLHRELYKDDIIETQIVPHVPRKGKFKGWGDQKMFEEFTWFSDYELHRICREYGAQKRDKDGKKIPGIKALKRLMLPDEPWMDSGKVEKFVELIKGWEAENAKNEDKEPNRTLVFSQFVKTLDILEDVMQTEGIAFIRLDGSTPTDLRQDIIDKFHNEKDIQVFMITTRSGGAGINLACANKVIVLDSSFNPQDDIQAENRAHRIGQTRPVEVITLITTGTIEEQIYKLGQSKLALDKRVAGGDADKVAEANEALLEDLLMKGEDIPTPPNELINGDEAIANGVGAEENGVKEEMAKGNDVKTEEKIESRDLKDAFAEGMKAKGLIVKGETIQD
jgi:SWI/SNF-related matrix-associated actin-dependent regulator 1 of chromatin subfamily A